MQCIVPLLIYGYLNKKSPKVELINERMQKMKPLKYIQQ